MSSAESSEWPIYEPIVEAITINPDNDDTEAEEQLEDTLALELISDENREFVLEMAQVYGAKPRQIIDTMIESYQELYKLTIEDGGILYVLGRDGKMHPLYSNESDSPAAA